MGVSFRAYRPRDRAACLAVFDANTPAFFLATERPDFEAWLDGQDGPGEHLVAEDASGVVGCAGLWFTQAGEAQGGLAWGMVRPGRQRQGIGTQLSVLRLARLAQLGVTRVVLDTTQHTAPFYVRLGFQVERYTEGGYGPGIDRVDMVAVLGGNTTLVGVT